ncbi:hypothetical protein AVEN_30924-1 [Araneus ventricosus]|uniref:RNase H type-1 domain-containing protein n=1 Tax=Araneus ventricosus TaxID=182803 RepID=A0A4Y2NQ80_ARAVE|nr:hypothetical protein AVEN_30924-1 [Araneus ventricosus]
MPQGGKFPSIRTPIKVYKDGSKINDQTGSAYCAISNEAITKTWKAMLSPTNTVFQAEMLAFNQPSSGPSLQTKKSTSGATVSLASKNLNPFL